MRRALYYSLRYVVQYLKALYEQNTAVTDSEKAILEDCIDKLWSIIGSGKVPF